MHTLQVMENYNKTLIIIMADDDADDHFFFQEALKTTNRTYKFTSVYNGVQLLDLLLNRGSYASGEVITPDCIILDLNMPVSDGLTALAQIKAQPHLRNIPVYVFSTTRNPDDMKKVKDLGAANFYTKPPHYEKLREVIEEIFSNL